MKLALINLANNITNFKTTPSGETIYFKKMLELIGYDVDIISKKVGEYTVSFENVNDINDYDKLLVVNGAINFFGGKENEVIIQAYKYMSQFKGRIFYLLTDLRLPFKQLWPAIKNRGWGYTEDEVYVNEKNMIVISQTHNLDIVKQLMPNLQLLYFPLERYKLLFTDINRDVKLENKKVDLIYGGSFRAGIREKKMVDFLFDTDYSVEFYGNAKEKQFKKVPYNNPPEFTGKVKFDKIVEKNSEALATLIIGDALYNGNHISLRVWESLLSSAVTFIDNEFDPKHTIINNDWFYVKDKADLAKKIASLKDVDDETRNKVLSVQWAAINKLFNKEKFLRDLEDTLDW